MKKLTAVATASLLVLLTSSVIAFDLGKVLKDAVEKKIRVEVEKALSTALPGIDTHAKKDDGKGMNLNQGVVIFGYNGCPYCRKAYAFMRSHNIRYTLMDTRKDAKAGRIARQKGIRGVPVIYVSGERYDGFSQGGYTKLFRKHGMVK